MKTSIIVCSILVLCAAFSLENVAQAADTSYFMAPGGIWWQPKSRITIDKDITLTADTTWMADELFINSNVVTSGLVLNIHAHRLIWGARAQIQAFSWPASFGADGPEHQTAAPDGPKSYEDDRFANRSGGKGGDGADGKPGAPGNDGRGAKGPIPGEIALFAGDIVGKLKVFGVGQRGGGGGTGGPGQKGGTGGQGADGDASIWHAPVYAGTGGVGGKYGKGGRGGTGGQGGSAVPVKVLYGSEPKSSEMKPVIICKPGIGGTGGDPGIPGEPGGGGAWRTCRFRYD